MQGQDPEITIEVIGKFLISRGWRQSGDFCWEDPQRKFSGSVHWTAALEAQFDRDHKAAAAAMTRGFAAMAQNAAGASR